MRPGRSTALELKTLGDAQHLPQFISSSFSDRGYKIQTTIIPEKYIRICPVNRAVLKALPAVKSMFPFFMFFSDRAS
jgi:hypothetical protein